MNRIEMLVGKMESADKLFIRGGESRQKADKIIEWLDEEVTAADLEKMTSMQYQMFEAYGLGFSDDVPYHEGWM